MTEYEAYEQIRNLDKNAVTEQGRFPPCIDEAALLAANRLITELGQMSIALTYSDWMRIKNKIQVRIANSIRESIFEPPKYPGEELEVDWP